jgi:hypothetical protein
MKRGETSLPLRSAVAKQLHGHKSNAPCIFLARGACRNGRACSFSHESYDGAATTATAAEGVRQAEPLKAADAVDSRSQVPCHFYIKGRCLKGNACPFLHSTPKDDRPNSVEIFDDSNVRIPKELFLH